MVLCLTDKSIIVHRGDALAPRIGEFVHARCAILFLSFIVEQDRKALSYTGSREAVLQTQDRFTKKWKDNPDQITQVSETPIGTSPIRPNGHIFRIIVSVWTHSEKWQETVIKPYVQMDGEYPWNLSKWTETVLVLGPNGHRSVVLSIFYHMSGVLGGFAH